MTTIVMKQGTNKVEVAFDSKVSDGRTYSELVEPKVAEVNGMWFGVAGRLRVLNAVHHMDLNPPAKDVKGEELTKWVHRVLVPKLRQTIHESIPEGAWHSESNILAVVNKTVYLIESDYCVMQMKDGIYAIGSGSDHAKSALKFGASVKEAVKFAGQEDIWSGYTIKTLTI